MEGVLCFPPTKAGAHAPAHPQGSASPTFYLTFCSLPPSHLLINTLKSFPLQMQAFVIPFPHNWSFLIPLVTFFFFFHFSFPSQPNAVQFLLPLLSESVLFKIYRNFVIKSHRYFSVFLCLVSLQHLKPTAYCLEFHLSFFSSLIVPSFSSLSQRDAINRPLYQASLLSSSSTLQWLQLLPISDDSQSYIFEPNCSKALNLYFKMIIRCPLFMLYE